MTTPPSPSPAYSAGSEPSSDTSQVCACGAKAAGVVLGKRGEQRGVCREHYPRVPDELLGAWLFEDNLMLPDVSVEPVKVACQQSVLEHIQRCLILLAPLAGMRLLDSERTDEQRVARTAYSTLHAVEKVWLQRLGKPTVVTPSQADRRPHPDPTAPSAQKGTPDLTASAPDLAADVVGTTGPTS